MGRAFFSTVVSGALAGFLGLAIVACDSKPDTALCGRYYRHLLALEERDGHPGAQAGLKTADAKRSIIEHCLQLERKLVECSLQARSLGDAADCETRTRPAAEAP